MRALDLGMRGGETAGPVAARTPRNSGFFYGVRTVRNAGVGRGGSERGNGGAGLGQEVPERGFFWAECEKRGHGTWGSGRENGGL